MLKENQVNIKDKPVNRTKKVISHFIFSVLYFLTGATLQSFTSLYATQNLPDFEKFSTPLPDLLLDFLPNYRKMALIDELFCSILLISCSIMLFFHKRRFDMLKRFLILAACIMIIRCFTVLSTRLSVPNPIFAKNNCYSQEKSTNYLDYFKEVFFVVISQGHSINGSVLCGDLIYSGHAALTTQFLLFIFNYVKVRKFKNLFIFIKIMLLIFYFLSLLSLLIGRYHYTVDLVVGNVIAFLLFNYYHLMVEKLHYQKKNGINRKLSLCWIPFFNYFEDGTDKLIQDEEYVFENIFCRNKKKEK